MEEDTNEQHEVYMNGDLNHDSEEKTTEQSHESTASSTKNIYMYRNGDLFYPGKRLVVNRRYMKTWDAFLEDVTKSLQSRGGAIRDIRTPHHGTRVRSLDDLMHNSRYVAVSKGEKLKLIDYENAIDVTKQKHVPRKLQPIRQKHKSPESPKAVEGRINELYNKSMVIHVYRNGDPFTRAINIVLRPLEQKHMSTVVKAIEERVCLPSNKAIRRVYNMSGEKVKYAKDIEDGNYYVVAALEDFADIQYGQYLKDIRCPKVHSNYRRVKYLNQAPTRKQSPLNKTTERSEDNDISPNRTQRDPPRSHRQSQKKEKQQQRPPREYTTEEEEAAKKIQGAYRGYAQRNPNLSQRKEKSESPAQNSQPKKKSDSRPPPKQTIQKKEEKSPRQQQKQQPQKKDNEKQQPQKKDNEKQQPQKKDNEKQQPQKKDNGKKQQKKEENKNKDEKTREYTEEEAKAATTIQAGYRGFKTRKDMKEDKNPKKEEEEDLPPLDDPELEDAAVKIQASFRGHRTRKEQKSRDKEEAASKIQAGFRGHKKREEIKNNEKEREKAAIKIQAGFRGYSARNQMKSNNKENDIDKEKAAIKIQAGYRGYKTRKSMKEKNDAAAKIQAGFRGYKVRNEKRNEVPPKHLSPEEQVKQRNEAASKIQANFRGYQYRNKQKEAGKS